MANALDVKCPHCGAEPGQPCIDLATQEIQVAPCRIRKQLALGHPIEGV